MAEQEIHTSVLSELFSSGSKIDKENTEDNIKLYSVVTKIKDKRYTVIPKKVCTLEEIKYEASKAYDYLHIFSYEILEYSNDTNSEKRVAYDERHLWGLCDTGVPNVDEWNIYDMARYIDYYIKKHRKYYGSDEEFSHVEDVCNKAKQAILELQELANNEYVKRVVAYYNLDATGGDCYERT